MPTFKCRDIGLNCPFEAKGKTDEEIMNKIADHAKTVHNMKTIPPDTMDKIRKAIKPK